MGRVRRPESASGCERGNLDSVWDQHRVPRSRPLQEHGPSECTAPGRSGQWNPRPEIERKPVPLTRGPGPCRTWPLTTLIACTQARWHARACNGSACEGYLGQSGSVQQGCRVGRSFSAGCSGAGHAGGMVVAWAGRCVVIAAEIRSPRAARCFPAPSGRPWPSCGGRRS